MNQLDAMRCFSRVAELGSFTRAADSLELSRAVASAKVRALERHLGVPLLARTTRRVTLTADGASYLPRCQRILAEIEVAVYEMRRLRERVEGRLRVDVPAMFGRFLPLPELPAFIARYPSLNLEIQYNERIVDLGAERIDVAVRFSGRRDPKLMARPIGVTNFVTCAAPAYLARHGRPASPDDLRRHQLIGTARGSRRPRDWLFRVRGDVRRLSLASQLQFNTIEGSLQTAVAGMGILQTADIIVQDLVTRGRLELLFPGTAVTGTPVWVVYQRANRVPAKVRVFADFMAELFRRWSKLRDGGSSAAATG